MEHAIDFHKDELLEKAAVRYLGENNYALAKEWYSYTLEPEWKYVVFIVRRAYLLALIMERITGRQMEESSNTIFLTDGALYSRCLKLAMFYREHHSFPRILLCDDALLHGRNINYFLESMEKGIIEALCTEYGEKIDEDEIKDKFAQAVRIHVLARSDEMLLLLDRYTMKIHSCSVYNITGMHDLSCRISTLISYSGLANASYIVSERITKEEFNRCSSYGFIKTVYQNVTEYAHLEPICVDDKIIAVLTLRIIPDELQRDEYLVIPFVFLPNMGPQETGSLWQALKYRLRGNMGECGEQYIEYMDALADVEGMRTFNEWVTEILSNAILWDFNSRYKIDLQSCKEYEEQLRIVERNYNVTGIKQTKEYLKGVINGEYLSKQDVISIIKDTLREDRKICSIERGGANKSKEDIAYALEEYWYKQAMREEKEARKVVEKPYEGALEYSARRVRGCAFALEEIFDGYDKQSVLLGFAYFLQMMDAGIIGVSSYTSKYIQVVGYSQFVKAGEMSLLIYPMRVMEYIPLLVRMQQFCRKMDLDLQELARVYCRTEYSHINMDEVEKIEDFLEKLKDGSQTPKEWDICYENKVMYIADDLSSKNMERRRNYKRIDLILNSHKHVKDFEKYLDEVVFG